MPLIIIATASNVNFTFFGGLPSALISSKCFRFIDFTASCAAKSAGSAFAKSASASSLRASTILFRSSKSSLSFNASIFRVSASF
jgi:hypothetical protein